MKCDECMVFDIRLKLLSMTNSRQERIHHILQFKQNDLTVVLENVHDPHNIAAVLRTCDAVGISEVFVLNNGKRIPRKFGNRSSSSAIKWMKVNYFTEVDHCFETVKKKYPHIYSTHLSEQAVGLYALDLTQPTALVFGNERSGLTNEVLAHCNGNFVIPQVGIISSLNISVACAVSLYEGYRQKKLAGHYEQPNKLSTQDREELLKFWEVTEQELDPLRENTSSFRSVFDKL